MCTSLHQGITVVIVVVVVIVVAVLSRYLASCLPKCVVDDFHKIPPSHPEINPIPAHPNFTFAANAYLLSFFFRAPTLSRFFSPFHYIHPLCSSLFSPDFSLHQCKVKGPAHIIILPESTM